MFEFKGKAVDVKSIGQTLGVLYVLEGSVQKSKNQLRITAQLIDTANGAHVWAERYDRPYKDIFEIQDEIARKVVGAVAGGSGGVLVQMGRKATERKRPESLEAYELVLRAANLMMRITPDAYAESKTLLEKAIELDPKYARARADLAFVETFGWVFRASKNPVSPDQILHTAAQAVLLDPTDPRTHRSAAWAYFFAHRLGDFERDAGSALQLAPNDAEILAEMGFMYTISGQYERGIALVERAHTLNRDSASGWYESALFYDSYHRRDYVQALNIIQQHPEQYLCEQHIKYIAAYGQTGDTAKVKEHWDACAVEAPDFSAEWARKLWLLWNVQEADLRHLIGGFAKAGHPCKAPDCS